MIAKTFQGLEEVLAQELTALGANDIEIGRRMVSFSGDKEMMYKANFCLRTAIRILKPIKSFTAKNADEVYDQIKAICWEEILNVEKTFAVDAVVQNEDTVTWFSHGRTGGFQSEDSLSADVRVWKELFEHIIWSSPIYNKVAEGYENYSMRGMERMREMMDATFTNFMGSHGGVNEALEQLGQSMLAARELYIRMLVLPVAIADLRMSKIEAGRAKRLPTSEDINPDMRLTEAPLLDAIRENVQVQDYVDKFDIDWQAENQGLIEALLKTVMESPAYVEYKAKEPSLEADYVFYRTVFTDIIANNEAFLEDMESKSVFWNDDIDIMTEFAIKTYRRFEEGMGQNALLAMYKDDDDRAFGLDLFRAVVNNKEQYRAVIDECLDTKIWETERLAYMDVIILETAIAEMLNFPSIPLKVTINEYIEMAKSYSTNKSGMFVNGLLGVIVAKLRREGKLLKTDANVK